MIAREMRDMFWIRSTRKYEPPRHRKAYPRRGDDSHDGCRQPVPLKECDMGRKIEPHRKTEQNCQGIAQDVGQELTE